MRASDFFNSARNKPFSTYLAAACFLLIAVATSYRLGAKSLWYDEAISAFYSTQSVLVIARMSLLDHVPPLYYWALKVYSGVFGRSDLVLRSFSVIFNLAAAIYFWRLVKEHFDERTSLYALVLSGTSNYLLTRAQTARAYPLFLFFTIAAIYYFFRASEDDKRRRWFLYSACLLCSLYSLYLGVATVATLSVFVTWSAARKLARWHLKWLVWTAVSIAGFLPWVILLKITHPSAHADWFMETMPSGNLWRDFVGLFRSFFAAETVGGLRFGALLAGFSLLIVGLVGVYSLAAWRRDDRARKMLLFTCLYFVISVLVNYVLNVFASVGFAAETRFIFLCPFAYLLAAAGISKLPLKALQGILLAALMLPNVIAMVQTYATPSLEDWRGVAKYIERNWRTDDLIIFSPGYMNIAFDFYAGNDYREIGYPKGLINPTRMYWGYHYMRGPDEAEKFLQENSDLVRRSRRIWLILSHNVLFDRGQMIPDASMLAALRSKPSMKRELIRFNGVFVHLFSTIDGSPVRE